MAHRIQVLVLVAAALIPGRALAQSADDVKRQPIEAGVSMSFERLRDAPERRLGGFGPAFSLAKDFNQQVAIAGEIALLTDRADGGHATAFAAGPRLSTGFFRESNSVGRFYAQVLAGGVRERGRMSATLIAGVGADALVDERHGVAVHWSLDYRGIAAPEPNLSGVRLTVGLVFGPHMTH